jgi:hypothetical protein
MLGASVRSSQEPTERTSVPPLLAAPTPNEKTDAKVDWL